MDFGKNIIKLREKAGLSQAEFARLLKVPQPNITRWENGSITPSAEAIVNIANALGVTTDDVLLPKNRQDTAKSPDALTKRITNIKKLPTKDQETIYQVIDVLLKSKK